MQLSDTDENGKWVKRFLLVFEEKRTGEKEEEQWHDNDDGDGVAWTGGENTNPRDNIAVVATIAVRRERRRVLLEMSVSSGRGSQRDFIGNRPTTARRRVFSKSKNKGRGPRLFVRRT